MTAIATQGEKSAREKSEASPDLADTEAVARAREGDHEAFRVLVGWNEPDLLPIVDDADIRSFCHPMHIES